MPGVDLTFDRLKMQALAKGIQVPRYADRDIVDQMIKDIERGHVALESKDVYPPSAFCPENHGRWVRVKSPGVPHYIGNPAKQRKAVGTRRVGAKGRKMPTRGACSGCHTNVILVDNVVNRDWPLYITKLTITEWP